VESGLVASEEVFAAADGVRVGNGWGTAPVVAHATALAARRMRKRRRMGPLGYRIESVDFGAGLLALLRPDALAKALETILLYAETA